MNILDDIIKHNGNEYIYSNINYNDFICGSLKITKKVSGKIFVYMPNNLAFIQIILGLIYRGLSFTIVDKKYNIENIICNNSTIITDITLNFDIPVKEILVSKFIVGKKIKKYKGKNFIIRFIDHHSDFTINNHNFNKSFDTLQVIKKYSKISFPDKLPSHISILFFMYAICNKISLTFGKYDNESINIINHYNYHIYNNKKNNIIPVIDNKYKDYISYKGNIITYNNCNLKSINTLKNTKININSLITKNESSPMMKYFENYSYVIDIIENIDIDKKINHLSLYSVCYCKYIDNKFIKNNENILVNIKNGDFNEKNVVKYLLNTDNVFVLKILKYENTNNFVLIYNPNIWNVINNVFYNYKDIYKPKYVTRNKAYELLKFYVNIIKLLFRSVFNKLKLDNKYIVNKKQISINDIIYSDDIINSLVKIIQKVYSSNFIILNVNFNNSYIVLDDSIYDNNINSIKNNIFISILKLFDYTFINDSIVGIYIINNDSFNSLLNKNKKYKIIIVINIKKDSLDIQFYYKSNDLLFENIYNNIVDYANNI